MNPLIIFVFLVLGLPTLELFLLIEIGSEIGALPAIFLVVFTAVLGGLLVRQQGLSTLMRVRAATERDEVPALEMMEGAMLLLGGLLLLIPGFLTDAVGFLCLVPPLRRALIMGFVRKAKVQAESVQEPGDASPQSSGRVIEGEYQRHGD